MVLQVPDRIGNWWILETLGAGYSGSIFKARHIHNGQVVALKVQDVHHECPTNRYERSFYPLIQGGIGMPTLYAAGVEWNWDYLAIDLLGSSLDALFKKSGKDRMDLRSVCCIAMQLISRLEFMHSRGVLHRDIQLGNCTVGLPPNESTIYMIDFGFSKIYIDQATKRHIPDSKIKRDFLGNYWFTSVGVHCKGKVPSRRDDLEATALMLIHLLTPGGLPWTRNGVPKTDHAHNRLKKMKRTATPEDLCSGAGVGIPPEFEEFLRYCRGLKFAQAPDYKRWRDEFGDLLQRTAGTSSDSFVWPPPPLPAGSALPMPQKSPGKTPGPASMEDILNGLAKMGIQERTILGDKKNIEHAVQAAKQQAAMLPFKKPTKQNTNSLDVIVISSDDESQEVQNHPAPMQARINKANEIVRLTRSAGSATDNGALAAIVFEFARVLKDGRGKTLTKEGFRFLDAVHKQLADPSVFLNENVGLRAANTDPNLASPLEKNEKLVGVRKLKEEVARVGRNSELGRMVAEFGALTARSASKTVTKDGLAFLEGLASRLKVLHERRASAATRPTPGPTPLVPAVFNVPAIAAAS